MTLRIDAVSLYHIEMPLVHPIETSFGRAPNRPILLVELHAGGLTGWGECVAFAGPWYTAETIGTAWHVLQEFLIPALLGADVAEPEDAVARFSRIRGHAMARAALEAAVWDVLAQQRGISLQQMLGGTRERVAVGVSMGIEPDIPTLLRYVAQYWEAGYRRIKLKIKPGWDVAPVRAVREKYPDLLLQVDANSGYTLEHAPLLRELDQFGLLLIEQPLHHEDIVDHATLQAQLETPICLDESIHSPLHARWALQLNACRILNIKVGRVGGLSAALEIHDMCAAAGVPVWCGGMMETNVGRAENLALASLPNFTLPGDVSASARYYEADVAFPNFELNDDSTITVPTGVGRGVTVDRQRLDAVCVRRTTLRAGSG